MKKQNKLISLLCLICIAAFYLYTSLGRPIWFDEAWSIMVYALGPFNEIYSNYNAPNNHILFNIFLRLWIDTVGGMFFVSAIPFRLMTLGTSLITVFFMFNCWHKRLGLYSTFLTILCFIVSIPFMIYGTAVRGYMLSLLFVLLGLESGLRLMERGNKKYALLYFLSALGAVAVIPSNLFAFAMITIIPLRKSKKSTIDLSSLIKERWLISFLPLLAFLIFYGPIFMNLFRALKNNNGWLHPLAASIHIYSAFILTLIPIIVISIAGMLLLLRIRKTNAVTIISFSLIFLTPLLVIALRKPAPFPRVFFQMWPIWLFIIGIGIKHLFGVMRLKRTSKKTLSIRCSLATLIIVSWGIIQFKMSEDFSTIFTNSSSHDDFFNPSYMRLNFRPAETVDKLIELSEKKSKTVFLSQNADFISIIFYGKIKGLDDNFWILDYPGKTKFEGASDTDRYYIVARNENDMYLIKEKFNIKDSKSVFTDGLDKIYEVDLTATEGAK